MSLIIFIFAVVLGNMPGFSAFDEIDGKQESVKLFDSAHHYNNLGIASYSEGNFEQAGAQFRKSLALKRQKQEHLSIDLASTYTNLGVVSRRLYKNEEAMHYYDTAGFVYLNHYGPDHSMLGAVYQNQGIILSEQRDFSSALSYYNNALRIFLINNNAEWVATLYNNIGIAHERAGAFEEANEYYFRSIKQRQMFEPYKVAIPAGNLANSYKETGDILLAGKYYRMAIDAIINSLDSDHPYLATNLMNYGTFLITNAGEPGKGHEMLVRALEIYTSSYGEKGHNIARTLMNIGYYHEVTGNYRDALHYYQKSLIANSESFSSTNLKDNPGMEDHAFFPDYMLASLKHKAYAQFLLAGEGDQLAVLEASLATYTAAMKFIEHMRVGHQTEESRILLSENEHKTYIQAIHVAWEMYNLTTETAFLEEAFMFSEKSKASSLLSSIRDVEARSFGGVPRELLEKEQDLKKGITAFGDLIHVEQRKVDADKVKIAFWKERAFSLELELRQLIGRLEEEYPDYYALKYNQQVSTVKNIMKEIDPRDALVSYTFGDSLVYIFIITSRDAEFYCVRPRASVEEMLKKLLDVLTSGNMDRRVNEDFMTFTGSAGFFYNLLIDPLLPVIRNKRLIIVPDGLLAYVPFELLLSSDTKSGAVNYKALPYLLRDYTLSYSYSATLWLESLKKVPEPAQKLLAMAPSYAYLEMPATGIHQSRQLYRDKLVPLPGAREEAIRISEMMDGEVFLDSDATELKFKQIAGEFKLLHLAMHTLIDDENPMYSKLVFAEQDDYEEDGLLNTYEIYNLNLNASLAVLSSCRSGFGTLRRGEGVLSLARGFLYAGVPSIVVTNWEIEDKSGAEIMVGFYRYLLKGFRKDDALRLARLDFLDNTDMLRAHPYFWGAYVCIGNPDKVFDTHRQFHPLLTFLLLLIIMIVILWRGQIRSS